MRLPPLRFTVKRMMVAVALVGTGLGVAIERRKRFERIADHHRAEFQRLARRLPQIGYGDPFDDPILGPVWRRLEWHEPMRLKYEHAARYPWLPVEPDPPEPE